MPSTTIKIRVRREGNFDLHKRKSKVKLRTIVGVRQMLEDIHRVSRPITPMLTGDLRKDVKKKVSRVGDVIRGEIEWHRPYAWYQERGYTSGPVKRYTTPGTRAHFAEESVKKVTAKTKKYLGNNI